MSHDPHAQIDQTVLEMIERSPVGAVPHTPAYQDALNRLRASHQVYASADHKGGFVTVRSLAALPAFHAHNLAAFLSGTVEPGDLEPDADIFSRYVQSLPVALRAKAEAGRALVVARRAHHRAKHGETLQEPPHSLLLIPGTGPHPGLAGNYLHGSIFQTAADMRSGAWEIHLHDADDGAAMCEVPSRSDAWGKLDELLASAPFQLSELESLGFHLN